jgi:hypothetical protein
MGTSPTSRILVSAFSFVHDMGQSSLVLFAVGSKVSGAGCQGKITCRLPMCSATRKLKNLKVDANRATVKKLMVSNAGSATWHQTACFSDT